MSPHLEERLYDAFPRLFAEHALPRDVSPMGRGITCGDGWFSLVWALCCDLQELIGRGPEEGREGDRDAYRAVQVKETFGGRRFYPRRGCCATASPGEVRSWGDD